MSDIAELGDGENKKPEDLSSDKIHNRLKSNNGNVAQEKSGLISSKSDFVFKPTGAIAEILNNINSINAQGELLALGGISKTVSNLFEGDIQRHLRVGSLSAFETVIENIRINTSGVQLTEALTGLSSHRIADSFIDSNKVGINAALKSMRAWNQSTAFDTAPLSIAQNSLKKYADVASSMNLGVLSGLTNGVDSSYWLENPNGTKNVSKVFEWDNDELKEYVPRRKTKNIRRYEFLVEENLPQLTIRDLAILKYPDRKSDRIKFKKLLILLVDSMMLKTVDAGIETANDEMKVIHKDDYLQCDYLAVRKNLFIENWFLPGTRNRSKKQVMEELKVELMKLVDKPNNIKYPESVKLTIKITAGLHPNLKLGELFATRKQTIKFINKVCPLLGLKSDNYQRYTREIRASLTLDHKTHSEGIWVEVFGSV